MGLPAAAAGGAPYTVPPFRMPAAEEKVLWAVTRMGALARLWKALRTCPLPLQSRYIAVREPLESR